MDLDSNCNMSAGPAAPATATAGEISGYLGAVMFFRALDKISYGLLLLVILLSFKNMLDALPIPLVEYFYIAPIYMIFSGVMHFPDNAFQLFLYKKALHRLALGSLCLFLLSPFLQWWMQNTNSYYLLFNFLLFCLCGAFFIASLSNLFHAVSKEEGFRTISIMSRLTRLGALYLMMAPLLAFFVTVLFGKCSGQDILLFVARLEKWELLIFISPVILALSMLLQLRYAKYRNIK